MILRENIDIKINAANKAAGLIYEIIKEEDKITADREQFFVIALDPQTKVKYVELVAMGTATECHTAAPEIFRRAIEKRAVQIVLAHNHPSGDQTPSEHDIKFTERITKAGDIIGIEVVDHIIVTNDGFYTSIMHGNRGKVDV